MRCRAQGLGGRVASGGREYGGAGGGGACAAPLFAGLEEQQTVWMNHGDSVKTPPPGARIIGSTPSNPVAGFEDRARGFYAVQFHPEVRHTEHGSQILENFIFRVCGIVPEWTMASFREQKIEEIRRQAGNGAVVCALAGRVDSSVTAILLREALGDRWNPILVDHGLMRAHAADPVIA